MTTPAEVELERKVPDNELQEKNILLVRSKPNESHIISRYQHNNSNGCMMFIEYIRWKFNLFFLFRPFAFLSYIPIKYHFHQCIYRLTVTEIIFWTVLIYIAYPQTIWFIQTLSNNPIIILGSDSVIGRRRLLSSSEDGGGSGEGFGFGDSDSESGERAEIFLIIGWILALRNTFLFNLLFGLSFERIITMHRIVCRFAILLSFYHFWEYRNYNWFAGDCFTGSMALIPLLIMFITSLNIFRRNIFTIFLKLHWIGFIMFTYYIYIHGADFILIPAVITLLDIMYRWYTTFSKPVIIEDITILHGNVIRIIFTKTDFKYEAGQYIFVCIPAIDFTQYHPFSLSSSPHHPNNICIHIRVLGDWTAKLKKLASHYQSINNDNCVGNKFNNLTMFVEGAYGCVNIPLHKYESIVMISGGIGITPLQSIFNELVHNISSNSNGKIDDYMFNDSQIKRIHFVWVVRDPNVICEFNTRHWAGITFKDILYYSDCDNPRLPKFFSPDLLIVKNESQILQRTEVITHFYVTRVLDEEIQNKYIKKYPILKFGRPNINQILKNAKDEYNNNNSKKINCIDEYITNGKGVAVLSCGPKGMLKDVKKYATKHGIDCHTEIFEF